eukprot:TRINITY_DN13533_c0_g1_i1.p1 TRINITY_DN13533_c0_g1~~TRINITY_DN13533_c0_g1_i1.p1  ORF type:complete len:670 (-),score=126.43 TRINITY_DN13533_c0_g1_i1:578-2587(-)
MGGESIEASFQHVLPVLPAQEGPLVDPQDVKLTHRIGKGPLGEVWLATLHNATEDFDEFHEVAVKLLPDGVIKDDETIVSKFKELFAKVHDLDNICAPQGICRKNGQICIVMKLYEKSVGDVMGKQPEKKLTMEQFFKYGSSVCRSLLNLHAQGILALNLKPNNFLVDDHDNAVVGQFAIPLLISDSFPADPRKQQPPVWLGTPNYMAPEAWSPLVRGPIGEETDSWSLACALLEMLTGEVPWAGMKDSDIYSAVVLRREKPSVPSNLPVAIGRVLQACFEYDYRSRPRVKDLLKAFLSPESAYNEGDWVLYIHSDNLDLYKRIGVVRSTKGHDTVLLAFPGTAETPGAAQTGELVEVTDAYKKLSLVKDPFALGDTVRVKASVVAPRFGWSGASCQSEGPIVGMRGHDGALWVRFPDSVDLWQGDPAEMERVSLGITIGTWVRLKSDWPSGSNRSTGILPPSRVGIVHSVVPGNKVKVAFCGRETLWLSNTTELEQTEPFTVGQFVRLKEGVVQPRFGWLSKKSGNESKKQQRTLARIKGILPSGLLVVNFPGHLRWPGTAFADPDEVEVEQLSKCHGFVQKYRHLEAMHWSVRPVIALVGFFLAARLGRAAIGMAFKASSSSVRRSNDSDSEDSDFDGMSEQHSPTGTEKPSWLSDLLSKRSESSSS